VKPFDSEAVLISKLFAAGRSGRTWSQCLAWCYSEAEKVGQRFRVPAYVTVAGSRYPVIPKGSPHAHRRISATFPWTVGKWRDACWHEQEAESMASR